MYEWTTRYNSNINIINVKEFIPSKFTKPIANKPTLNTGPIPKRKLDEMWGRHSYSSWTIKHKEKNIPTVSPPDEKLENDSHGIETTFEYTNAKFNELKPISTSLSLSPLSNFPRGPNAGNCIHRILEQLDFELPVNSSATDLMISEELERSGID